MMSYTRPVHLKYLDVCVFISRELVRRVYRQNITKFPTWPGTRQFSKAHATMGTLSDEAWHTNTSHRRFPPNLPVIGLLRALRVFPGLVTD
jgi:hypothetical protein